MVDSMRSSNNSSLPHDLPRNSTTCKPIHTRFATSPPILLTARLWPTCENGLTTGWTRRTTSADGPESAEMYNSDMDVYLSRFRSGPRQDAERLHELESNIRQMKAWAAAGE